MTISCVIEYYSCVEGAEGVDDLLHWLAECIPSQEMVPKGAMAMGEKLSLMVGFCSKYLTFVLCRDLVLHSQSQTDQPL